MVSYSRSWRIRSAAAILRHDFFDLKTHDIRNTPIYSPSILRAAIFFDDLRIRCATARDRIQARGSGCAHAHRWNVRPSRGRPLRDPVFDPAALSTWPPSSVITGGRSGSPAPTAQVRCVKTRRSRQDRNVATIVDRWAGDARDRVGTPCGWRRPKEYLRRTHFARGESGCRAVATATGSEAGGGLSERSCGA